MAAMYNKNQSSHQQSKSVDSWAKLVSACTRSIGGFYQEDGSILRSTCLGIAPQVDKNSQLANLLDRTHHRVRFNETRRQLNIETILAKASILIHPQSSSIDVDEDWLHLFFSYAQDISSPETRDVWAQALAAEVKRPGSISKRSLMFLRTCDLWELKAFEKVAAYAFIGDNGHPFIFRSDIHDPEDDPIFTESKMLSVCIAAGLVTFEPAPLQEGFAFDYVGERQVVARDARYYIHRFTKIGSDLFNLMGMKNGNPKKAIERRLAWNFISDFVEFESAAS